MRPAPELAQLWFVFLDLDARREFTVVRHAVVAKPISFEALHSHLALFRAPLLLWERRLVLDLDDAVLPIINAAKSKGGIPVNDTERALAAFRRAAERG